MEDPSELFTETMYMLNRNEHSLLGFKDSFWIYAGSKGFHFQSPYHPLGIVLLEEYRVKILSLLG